MFFLRFGLLYIILLLPFTAISDENIAKSKRFIEKLGKEVIEKVSDENLSVSERHLNFKNLYLTAFDNYYISRFVLGRHWKKMDSNLRSNFV